MAFHTPSKKRIIELNGYKLDTASVLPGSNNEVLFRNYMRAVERIKKGELIRVEDILRSNADSLEQYIHAFTGMIIYGNYPARSIPLTLLYNLVMPVTSVDGIYYISSLHSKQLLVAVTLFGVIGSEPDPSKRVLGAPEKRIIDMLLPEISYNRIILAHNGSNKTLDLNRVALAWVFRGYYVSMNDTISQYLEKPLSDKQLYLIYSKTADLINNKTLSTMLIEEKRELSINWYIKKS